MNTRRKVLVCLAAGAWPLLAGAQPAKMWRLGILSIRSRPLSLDNDVQYAAFLQGLRELGYVEGRNLTIEWRFAHGNYDLLPALAAELVALKVDAIAVVNVPVIRAAQRATKSIPIVMLTSSDPVGGGFVESLARPGGNITGLTNINVDLTIKQLELLKTLIPKLSTVAFLANPANPAHRNVLATMQAAAGTSGIRLMRFEASSLPEMESAFSAMAKARADGLIVGLDARFLELRDTIVKLTLRHRLPSVFAQSPYVKDGGLMSYGMDYSKSYHHAATYVDRIFKGAKPADLPVESLSTIQLLINRKTAAALGLTIPPEMLFRADVVMD